MSHRTLFDPSAQRPPPIGIQKPERTTGGVSLGAILWEHYFLRHRSLPLLSQLPEKGTVAEIPLVYAQITC